MTLGLASRDLDPADLATRLSLTPEVVTRRLAVLGLGPEERARLRAVGPQARLIAPRVIDGLYLRLTRCPTTQSWLESPGLVDRLKPQQQRYLASLFEDDFDWPHALRDLRIGAVHHRVRLTPEWFLASYGHLLCEHVPLLMAGASTVAEGVERVVALVKSALFDACLALDGYAMSHHAGAGSEPVPVQPVHGAADGDVAGEASAPTTSPVLRTHVADDDASERRAFLEIDDATLATLRALAPAAQQALPAVLDEFYALFSSWEETRALVPPPLVERLRREVGSFWLELFRGAFDRSYAASRSLVGIVHERVGLSAPLYVIGLARQVASLLRALVPLAAEPVAAAQALLRAVMFDLSFVLQAYVKARAEAVLRTDGFASELLAGLTAGVALLDAGLRVEAVNPALLQLFALDPRLVRHAHVSQVLPLPEAAELAARAWRPDTPRCSAVLTRGRRSFRATAMRLTSSSPNARESVALVLDEVTDLLLAQTEARRVERGYAQVIDAVQALMWEAARERFTLTLISRSAVDVTGYRDVALLGRAGAFTGLIPEPDRGAFVRRCLGLAVGERAELRHRLTRADGSVVWLRSEVACDRDDDGTLVLRGVSVDITASHLEEQRRLESIGRLAGGIAHEYNNRLTVVLSSLSLLEDPIAGPTQDELLREARLAAERCAALTRQILGVAQRQALMPRTVQINDVLGAAHTALARTLGDAVHFELRLSPDLWRCRVDERELEAAVVSLVANARASMPAGGRLTLTTRNISANDDAGGDEPAGVDLVELVIEDTGAGMDEAVRRRAFEPFFSTRPDAMGLGLSVVRGFVTQSGGRVALSSSAGRGTVVRIQFPKAPDPLPAAAMDPDDARPFVLAVDDEAPLRFVLQRLIQRLGLGVAVAGSSAEALAVLRSRRVDLLVTDVVLGGGDSGAELARQARTLRPSLPVVYVSGYTREELDLGALSPRDWFVAKPFVNAEFSLAVTEAVAVAGGAARKRA